LQPLVLPLSGRLWDDVDIMLVQKAVEPRVEFSSFIIHRNLFVVDIDEFG